jgi:hypothetical protein
MGIIGLNIGSLAARRAPWDRRGLMSDIILGIHEVEEGLEKMELGICECGSDMLVNCRSEDSL